QMPLPDASPIVNTATVTYTKEDNTTDSEIATETVLSDCDPVSDDNISVVPTTAEICPGESVTFVASFVSAGGTTAMPTNSNFVWRRGSDSGPVVHTGSNYNPTLTTAGTHVYYVSIEGGNACFQTPGQRVELTVAPRATAANIAVTDTELCAGESIDLSTLATAVSVTNPVLKFYSDAALTTELSPATVTPIVGTTIYYVTVSGDGLCENAPNTGAQITVTVNPRATAADIATQDVTICEGDATTLTASLSPGTAIANPVFKWYSDADWTTPVHTGASFMPSPALTATTTYYVTVSGTGICENLPVEAKEVTVTVTPRGQADFILIAAPAEICEGE